MIVFARPLSAAHGTVPTGPADLWNHWALEPAVVIGLAFGSVVYTIGVRRLWRRAGWGRTISRLRATLFAAGMLVLAVALISPLDPLSDVLFSAHMVQHLLLVLIAAPLLVAGAPGVAMLWAFEGLWRERLGRSWHGLVQRLHGIAGGEAAVALASVFVASAALWAWHLPRLYDLAVRREAVHAAEHFTFLLAAILFWAAVLRLQRRDRFGNGFRVVCVFLMAVQGSVLGALLTFADRPLYESHAIIPPAWGISPMADQQLAGLIMWVPPALIYGGVAAWLFLRWLDEEARRQTLERAIRTGGSRSREPRSRPTGPRS